MSRTEIILLAGLLVKMKPLKRMAGPENKVHRTFFVAFMVLIAVFFGNPAQAEEGGEIHDVSVGGLISQTKEWHGSKVRVAGFVRLGVGGDSIYDDEEAALNAKKGIWLEIKDPEIKKYRIHYDGSFCIVEGTVNKDNHGRLGGWVGAIEEITRFEYQRPAEKYIQA